MGHTVPLRRKRYTRRPPPAREHAPSGRCLKLVSGDWNWWLKMVTDWSWWLKLVTENGEWCWWLTEAGDVTSDVRVHVPDSGLFCLANPKRAVRPVKELLTMTVHNTTVSNPDPHSQCESIIILILVLFWATYERHRYTLLASGCHRPAAGRPVTDPASSLTNTDWRCSCTFVFVRHRIPC